CVHCGFCLPACPTYVSLGEEMDSPRGRIILMKQALEGELPLESVLPYVDRCLGCLGCVTACPSGVEYGELLTPFRAHAESRRHRTLADRLLRRLVLETLPYPGRFRLATRMAALAKPLRRLLPRRIQNMLDLMPAKIPPADPLPEVTPAVGARRARVALLAGCAQQVLAPQINRATVEVLTHHGVEVVVPPAQQCCGALAAHTGALRQAVAQAKHNLTAFPADVDAIVTNAAGCGSGMHEYPLWLEGEPEEAAARQFAERVFDVSVFLHRLGVRDCGSFAQPLTVAYHDACHLSHAQRVTSEPRQLLAGIDNLRLVEIPDGELCCGSAGTYNLEQPTIAADLGQRKAAAILNTGAAAVATGNIGCMTQIAAHLASAGRPLPVYHTMELLAMASRQSEKQ
ncbi:MAG: 4Fe-4S dicluster domain-containing protein, partial [Planctomycetia bacterium]|nr:4Fe-4S dicluster domain-containing protein [Planctomycetia bacterium]